MSHLEGVIKKIVLSKIDDIQSKWISEFRSPFQIVPSKTSKVKIDMKLLY